MAHRLQLIKLIKKESSLNARHVILKFVTKRNGHHRFAGKNVQSRNVSKDSLLVHKEDHIKNFM